MYRGKYLKKSRATAHGGKHVKKSWLSAHDVIIRTVGILFVLTMLSVWLLCGLHAKYAVSGSTSDSARVAKGVEIKVLEHDIELIKDAQEALKQDSVYKLLTDKEKKSNTYDVVLPGVDLPKDPFVKIEGVAEVNYELYITVDDKNLPDTVTYEVDTDNWTETPAGSKTYKYNSVIDSSYDGEELYILKNNEVKVSEKHTAKSFSLAFDARVIQVD